MLQGSGVPLPPLLDVEDVEEAVEQLPGAEDDCDGGRVEKQFVAGASQYRQTVCLSPGVCADFAPYPGCSLCLETAELPMY